MKSTPTYPKSFLARAAKSLKTALAHPSAAPWTTAIATVVLAAVALGAVMLS